MAPLLDKGVDPAPRWNRIDLLIVGGLTLASLALRLPFLNQGLWIDEIITLVKYARLPVAEIINQIESLNNHVFYSLMAHFSIAWFGESAWTLRLPALLFGVASIPAIYYLGRQIACRQVLAIDILLALAGLSMVPQAWKPKQDFKAALDYMAEYRLAGAI